MHTLVCISVNFGRAISGVPTHLSDQSENMTWQFGVFCPLLPFGTNGHHAFNSVQLGWPMRDNNTLDTKLWGNNGTTKYQITVKMNQYGMGWHGMLVRPLGRGNLGNHSRHQRVSTALTVLGSAGPNGWSNAGHDASTVFIWAAKQTKALCQHYRVTTA